MLKLLICLVCGSATAVGMLELREQRLNLTLEINRLHNKIESCQAELWNQQLSIAVATAPNSLAAATHGKDLKLGSGNQANKRSWVDDPDAQK